ncbi:hypothetical protein GlitD10_1283 [Gloeomargarita lithophora Alchichica-D10]|uniref:DUF3110 domain-containing protein n=1 Tax=Gloeomargarita lithophora Alchichica-D10 TaxID=1188229 RepID=A0A1J0ACG1_9CYAN|nr:DUF3110 domain-containing protein [Gloeomargarita lithophora]APB33603.1 hypothetical protein GlitD10_1283 [Gloeomargarita lithophora Alchichica-D10]
MGVYVLIYNPGTDNEGIHSLKLQGEDTILMFEAEDDALRFATFLEAQDFPVPTVEAIDPEEMQLFCHQSGFHCQLVPAGALLMPPETNITNTDWQPEPPAGDGLDEIRRRLERLL